MAINRVVEQESIQMIDSILFDEVDSQPFHVTLAFSAQDDLRCVGSLLGSSPAIRAKEPGLRYVPLSVHQNSLTNVNIVESSNASPQRTGSEDIAPSIPAGPVVFDGDEAETKHLSIKKLDGWQAENAGVHPEAPAAPSSQVVRRERKDSVVDVDDALPPVTEIVLGDYTIKLPSLPFGIPPAYPPRRRGFDRGDLETALDDVFG